jgi:D-glycero-D-manno-heptose 1,7-bisphosphate phosphatase
MSIAGVVRAMSPGRRPTAFLDRDGIVNVDTGYPHHPDELMLTPTAARGIARLNRTGCLTIVVTNQSGVARGLYDLATVDRFHLAIQQRLKEQDAHIDAFYVAPWHPDGTIPAFAIDHPDRKPGPGMILRAMIEWPIDPDHAVLFGDKASDIEAAARAGIPAERLARDTCDLDAAVAAWLNRIGLQG